VLAARVDAPAAALAAGGRLRGGLLRWLCDAAALDERLCWRRVWTRLPLRWLHVAA
jgi:hypothetical protein